MSTNVIDPLGPWKVSEGDYPFKGEPWEQLSFCLNYAVLAPSSHNTQPWQFKLEPDSVKLYADRTRALPTIDPEDRELIISCGAALGHLRLAIRYFGRTDEVAIFPDLADPDLLAIVRMGAPCALHAPERAMFRAIPHRRTNRQPFKNGALAESVLTAYREVAAGTETVLLTIRDEARRSRVAELVSDADRLQMMCRSFRRELASWIHPARSATRDGIPAYAYGISELLDFATPAYAFAMRTFDLGNGIAARDCKLVEGSPVIAVLATETDTPSAWVAAGESLSRVLLLACAHGVSASFLNQPLEVESMRKEFRSALGIGGFPQIVMRMGYGEETKVTPRRDVRDMLM